MSHSNFCYKLVPQKENDTARSGNTAISKEMWVKVRPTKRVDARKYKVNDCVEGTGESLWSLQFRKKLPVLGQIHRLPEIAGI